MHALRNFKTYFFRGMAALLPTVLTVWLFIQFYQFVQTHVSSHINRGMVRIMVFAYPYYPHVSDDDVAAYVKNKNPELIAAPDELAKRVRDPEVLRHVRIAAAEEFWVYGHGQVAGFLIAFVAVVFFGAFMASFVGKAIWRMFERTLTSAPIIRKIYPYIKQVTDFFLARQKLAFSRVVAIEYPRKGTWSVAMVTGKGLKKIVQKSDKEYLTVFVPTSPTPFTGYVIMLEKDGVIDLNMTIEEALRFTISGGVIGPEAFEDYEAKKETGDK